MWKQFHDALPANSSNKIPSNIQGSCLKSQLFGRAIDLFSGITGEKLSGENDGDVVRIAVYKRDGLCMVSETYMIFNDILTTKRGDKESMKGFRLRFAAGVAKCNAISESTKLPDCVMALMLKSNADITDSKPVSVLSSISSTSDLDENDTTTDFF